MTTLKIDTNHGQAAKKIVNHYSGELARYRAMNREALREERAVLLARRRATYRAFIRHPTVPWFGASMGVLLLFLLVAWGEPPTIHSALVLAACIFCACATTLFMSFQRRPLFDGLQLIKADLKLVEAFLAIKDAEAAYGVK